MGRLSCILVAVFCVGVVTVRGDDPWFPDPFKSDSPPPLYPSPDSPSPFYDAPPADGPSPWFPCGLWAKKTESWPAPYTPDTSVYDALGADAFKVYGQVSLLDGILSKGDDGFSNLLKEGITALLNAVDAHFKYTIDEIKKCFSIKTALFSEATAADQARLFKEANDAYNSP